MLYCAQAAVKYNRQLVQADQPQDAFTLRVRVEPTDSCTTNELRVCVRLVIPMVSQVSHDSHVLAYIPAFSYGTWSMPSGAGLRGRGPSPLPLSVRRGKGWPVNAPKMHQIAQICTHIFKNFPGVNTPGLPLLGGVASSPDFSPVPLNERPPSHFSELSRPVVQ